MKTMKTKIAILGMMVASLLLSINKSMAQADLAIGNVNAGYNSYDQNNGTITGVYFDILNNENSDVLSSFRIALFLVDPNNFNNRYEIYSITDNDGQSGNTVVEYDLIDVDFNNTSGIPAGDYRLMVCVDEDDDVFESDENNNCLYITTSGNDLTFNPSSVGINVNSNVKNNNVILYPNPTQSKININAQGVMSQVTLVNAVGQTVYTTFVNATSAHIDISNQPNGIYILSVVIDGHHIVERVVVQH